MATVRDLIKKALKQNGVLSLNEAPSDEEATDAFDTLNMLMASWSNEQMLTYVRVRESFTLTGSQSTYTIGTGGDFNTDRPIQIISAVLRLSSGGVDYPLTLITDEAYEEQISNKDVGGIPEFLNYDYGYPLGKIRLWAVPSTGHELHLTSNKELTQFTDIDDVVSLPPGWERMIITSLAVELAPTFGVSVTPDLMRLAKEAKGSVKSAITKTRTMDSRPEVGKGSFNIYSGY